MSNSHDFFKNMKTLFESKEDDDFSKKRADKKNDADEAWAKSKGAPKKKDEKKNVKEGWSDENPDEDKSEWAEKQQCMADDKRKADKEDAACKALDKAEKSKKAKKPANVKETSGEFFRRYADIITEAEDDEDPDVAKADKVKGKDGKTQKDVEKGKKLPPWLEKKDKEDEDKGAKKAKKDKDLTDGNLFLQAYMKRGLMEGKGDRVMTKRKMIVAESRKMITLAKSTKMPAYYRSIYVEGAQHAIRLVKSGRLNETQLNELGGGMWGGIKGLAGAAGGALKKGAQAVGNKVAQGAQAAGQAVQGAYNTANDKFQGAQQAAGQAVAQGAQAVKGAVGDAAKAVGDKAGQAWDATKGAAQQAGNKVAQGAQAVGDKVAQGAKAVKDTAAVGANKEMAKSALSELQQIGQLLTKLGTPEATMALTKGDAITLGELTQLLQAASGTGGTTESKKKGGKQLDELSSDLLGRSSDEAQRRAEVARKISKDPTTSWDAKNRANATDDAYTKKATRLGSGSWKAKNREELQAIDAKTQISPATARKLGSGIRHDS